VADHHAVRRLGEPAVDEQPQEILVVRRERADLGEEREAVPELLDGHAGTVPDDGDR
jgi:hypothetical protein